jgi:hypothetical protein
MPKPTDQPRAWLCEKGHLLGHVEWDGQGAKLLFYREALNPHDPKHGQKPEVQGIARGLVMIRCSIPGCGCEREWHADEESLKRFFDRRDLRKAAAKVSLLTAPPELG